MYGSATTKELKKKHSSRPVGGAETGSWVERTLGKAVVGGPGQARLQLVDPARWWIMDWAVTHSSADKLGGTTGEQDRPHNPGFQHREIKPQTSD